MADFLPLLVELGTEELPPKALPDLAQVLEEISQAANGVDLVGFYAAGPISRGFASSSGAFGWHQANSFNFDFSLFHENGQAVKASYAGHEWSSEGFARRFEQAREQLAFLGRPLRTLPPGEYRAYLAPAAMEEMSVSINEVSSNTDRSLEAVRRTETSAHDAMQTMEAGIASSHRVVGVGNIYASESLFRARIHPLEPAGRLGPRRCARLVAAVRETLAAAIEAGGSTLRDFVGGDGQPGYFQQELFVYGRGGEFCKLCGSTLRELKLGQRASVYCPKCQR